MTYEELLERLLERLHEGTDQWPSTVAESVALKEMLAVIEAAEHPVQVERCEAHGGVMPLGYTTGTMVSHCGCRNVYVLRAALAALRTAWNEGTSLSTVSEGEEK